MNAHPSLRASAQRGVALISSLLLLIIITILALSMFRSFGTQEKIAGNLREKDRALHAAASAQQYGEWWLIQGNNAAFYVTDLGLAGDGAGEAYQIDAYGYGSTAGTVAVVESTYEVSQGVVNRG